MRARRFVGATCRWRRGTLRALAVVPGPRVIHPAEAVQVWIACSRRSSTDYCTSRCCAGRRSPSTPCLSAITTKSSSKQTAILWCARAVFIVWDSFAFLINSIFTCRGQSVSHYWADSFENLSSGFDVLPQIRVLEIENKTKKKSFFFLNESRKMMNWLRCFQLWFPELRVQKREQ